MHVLVVYAVSMNSLGSGLTESCTADVRFARQSCPLEHYLHIDFARRTVPVILRRRCPGDFGVHLRSG